MLPACRPKEGKSAGETAEVKEREEKREESGLVARRRRRRDFCENRSDSTNTGLEHLDFFFKNGLAFFVVRSNHSAITFVNIELSWYIHDTFKIHKWMILIRIR